MKYLCICLSRRAQESQFSGRRKDASRKKHTVTISILQTRIFLSPTVIRLAQQVSLSTLLRISFLSCRLQLHFALCSRHHQFHTVTRSGRRLTVNHSAPPSALLSSHVPGVIIASLPFVSFVLTSHKIPVHGLQLKHYHALQGVQSHEMFYIIILF
jgi:hypothetical protein